MNETATLRARAGSTWPRCGPTCAPCAPGRPGPQFMAVVKADAYGHGSGAVRRAALEAGAAWLGTATPQEALALRAAGIGGRVLCWLWTPGGPWREASRRTSTSR